MDGERDNAKVSGGNIYISTISICDIREREREGESGYRENVKRLCRDVRYEVMKS